METEPPSTAVWEIPATAIPAPVRLQMARCLYGDEAREFRLILHRRSQQFHGASAVELEVIPAPVKENVPLTLEINGHQCHFTLAAPASVKLSPDAETGPAEALPLEGKVEWADTWPPRCAIR